MGEQVENLSLQLPATLAQNDSFEFRFFFLDIITTYFFHLLNLTCNYFAVPTLIPF